MLSEEDIEKIEKALLVSTELTKHQRTTDFTVGRQNGIKAFAQVLKNVKTSMLLPPLIEVVPEDVKGHVPKHEAKALVSQGLDELPSITGIPTPTGQTTAARHINDRKYKIENNRLVKRDTGKPIPEGMPLFILLAQDRKALAALTAYMMVLDTLEMREAVKAAVDDFRAFQEKYPEKMGEPTP